MPGPDEPRIADAVHVVVHNGVVSFVGSNSVNVSGYPPERYHGRHVLDLVHPDDRVKVERLLAPGWTGRIDEYVRLQEASGAWTWRHAEGVRTIEASGEPQSVLELRRVDGPPR